MDIFHEQLVKIKSTKTVLMSKILIWTMAVIICALSLYAMIKISPFMLFVGVGILYLAYKATASFNIEYEYSVTNGVIDIDKIINKSSRKRLFTFDCKQIERIERFDKNNFNKSEFQLCTDDFDNALVFIVKGEQLNAKIVISPNEKLFDYIKIFLPRSAL